MMQGHHGRVRKPQTKTTERQIEQDITSRRPSRTIDRHRQPSRHTASDQDPTCL